MARDEELKGNLDDFQYALSHTASKTLQMVRSHMVAQRIDSNKGTQLTGQIVAFHSAISLVITKLKMVLGNKKMAAIKVVTIESLLSDHAELHTTLVGLRVKYDELGEWDLLPPKEESDRLIRCSESVREFLEKP